MSFRRVLIPGSVVGVVYDDDSYPPPPNQEARLERALGRLFPADVSATLAVDIAWSHAEAAWQLRRAVTTLEHVRVDVTRSLRDSLSAAGLPVVDT
jgi:hypothetical protein